MKAPLAGEIIFDHGGARRTCPIGGERADAASLRRRRSLIAPLNGSVKLAAATLIPGAAHKWRRWRALWRPVMRIFRQGKRVAARPRHHSAEKLQMKCSSLNRNRRAPALCGSGAWRKNVIFTWRLRASGINSVDYVSVMEAASLLSLISPPIMKVWGECMLTAPNFL